MANNHQGSVEHAKKIIDEFSSLAKRMNINAAVKLQFRQLETFIHKDFKILALCQSQRLLTMSRFLGLIR